MKINTTVTDRRGLGHHLRRAAGLYLLAIAAMLLQGHEARAQWTPPDAAGNISSTNTGNVGIGTASPTSRLGVVGNASKFAVSLFSVGAGAGQPVPLLLFSAPGNTGDAVWNVARMQAGTNGVDSSASFLSIDPINPGGTGWATGLTIRAGGSVGIGTVTPASLLDISGSTGMTLRNSAASSGFSFFDRSTVPGDQVVFQGNAGNYSLFNVSTRGANVGTEKASGMAFWTVDIANTSNATQFQMQYMPAYGPVFFTQKFGTGAQGDKKISFQTAWQTMTSAPTQLVLDTNGNVGVGTATPASKLHVAGNITVDGNINAKYQDVAEWVPTTETLAAGTVVVLDASQSNHVLASTKAYDTRVAGVVSAQPGISLGEAGEGKSLVATTGRVKVRVDATRAPIQVGDLLVTSDVAGVAMKSQPLELGGVPIHRPGTLIGKALESLDKGTGEILVLLSLQ